MGNSDWAAVKAGYWSADKTQLISGLLDRKSTVAVFTRPRRFGKTFAMNMLQAFFEKTEKSNAHLFKGTKVWQNSDHRVDTSLGVLAAALHAHHKEKPVILIDEYDSPINYAAEMEAEGISVLKYGIGFSGKHVALA